MKLLDNGEGANADPDKSSKLSNKDASQALAKPGLGMFELDRGNVQVR